MKCKTQLVPKRQESPAVNFLTAFKSLLIIVKNMLSAILLAVLVSGLSTDSVSTVGVTRISSNSDTLSFLMLGDFGSEEHIPQELENAAAMDKFVQMHNSSFVLTTGDNFYENGTASVTDPLWKKLFVDVYSEGRLGMIPFWPVLGNHDFVTDPMSEIEYSKVNPRWVLPDFFSVRQVTFHGYTATFIFVSSDLLHYGYKGYRSMKAGQFERFGWTEANRTADRQLLWIEKSLQKYSSSDFLFVVAHHNLGNCLYNDAPNMLKLDDLLKKYKPTGYLFGHVHNLQLNVAEHTMYVQSGAGGHDHDDPTCSNITFASNSSLGFVHAKLHGYL
jgi:tartrate-resistant acid phosphatase type 5